MLALVWALLASHCRIESIPGFEFLRCGTEAQEPGGDHCRDNGCCSVESAQYHSSRQDDIAPVVVADLAPFDNSQAPERSLPPEICLGVLTTGPPGLLKSWQFSSRAALPPRAPSLVS